MLKRLLTLFVISFPGYAASAQNLVVNPGAETTPLGTGWTIVAAGGSTCAAGSAASTYNNWTMVPDGGVIYPAAHAGTHTFFPGCSATVTGGLVYELRQDINVSADATAIDGGFITYAFDGFIQTPVANPSPQGDAGRFVVDYLSASGTVIGVSYASTYQSRLAGSGTGWLEYTNTRLAPAGTRTVRIRLQAVLVTTPAVNVYFDDISLIRTSTLPVSLVSFSAKDKSSAIVLHWTVSDAVNFDRFEIEKSTDASHFNSAGTVYYHASQSEYSFSDSSATDAGPLFYRLKMVDLDNRFSYGPVLLVQPNNTQPQFSISPNPASSSITVSGLTRPGQLLVHNMNGALIRKMTVNAGSTVFSLGNIPKGVYVITYNNGKEIRNQRLVVY